MRSTRPDRAFGHLTIYEEFRLKGGGTVGQNTNKSTTVELNTQVGQITMNAAGLATDTEVTFTVTNSKVSAQDVVVAHHGSVGTAGTYFVQCTAVAAGSFKITVRNLTGGTLSEAIIVHFVVIGGAAV